MKKIISKLLLSFLVVITLFISLASYSQVKAVDWYAPDFGTFYSKVYDQNNPNEIFGERYTAAQVEWVFWGFLAMAINFPIYAICGSPAPLITLFTGNVGAFSCPKLTASVPTQPTVAKSNSNSLSKVVSLVFADRSFSGIGYVRNIGRNLHIVPQAKAASNGFGYGALDPILPLWSATRDASYVFFVIVILIIAFMIMFRVKLSPQVVITVQAALPRIVVAMILVTFSYAISGFLVDLMYVVIGLMSLIIGGMAGGNSVQIFTNMTTPAGGILGLIGFYLLFSVLGFASVVRAIFISAGTGAIFSGGFVALLLAIVLVILIIASLFVALKVAWLLLRTFVNIALLVIIAPLQFAFGTVAANLSFSSWIKSMASNLAVFPTVGLLFSLSFMFLASVIQQAFPGEPQSKVYAASSLLIGPKGITSQGWPPLFSLPGVTDQRPWLYLAMSIGLYFLIPKAADIIKSMIEGKPFAFGTGIGEPVGAAAGLGGIALAQRSDAAAKLDAQNKAREKSELQSFIEQEKRAAAPDWTKIQGWQNRVNVIDTKSQGGQLGTQLVKWFQSGLK